MTRLIALLPALNVPFQHRQYVRDVIAWLGDQRPDEVVIVGDVVAGISADDWAVAVNQFFEPLRTAYEGPVGIHDAAPQRMGSTTLHDLRLLEITLLPDLYDLAPGWVSTHGHGYPRSSVPGATALHSAVRRRSNVVMGNTMHLGIATKITESSSGDRAVTGMEVGNLIDCKRANHLKRGQTGFGLLTVDDRQTLPHTVPMNARGMVSSSEPLLASLASRRQTPA